MRVESSYPSKGKAGGWIHKLTDKPVKWTPPPVPEKVPTIDASVLMNEFSADTWPEMISQLASSLGVSVESLDAIGCAWAIGYNGFAFPMRNWKGDIIGIRLRDNSGHKWAVRGSRSGLFYHDVEFTRPVICEGPTDTAAAMTLGLEAIGRPACMGCEMEVVRLLERKHCSKAVILADNDDPGIKGATRLASQLPISCCIAVLPCKDIREFLNSGGTLELVNSIINSLVWTQPTIKANYQAQQHGEVCT